MANLIFVEYSIFLFLIYLVLRKEKKSYADKSLEYCINCGEKIDSDTIFCSSCNEQNKKVCKECGSLIDIEWRYCPFCNSMSKNTININKLL